MAFADGFVLAADRTEAAWALVQAGLWGLALVVTVGAVVWWAWRGWRTS